jgi:hypothetical protein
MLGNKTWRGDKGSKRRGGHEKILINESENLS